MFTYNIEYLNATNGIVAEAKNIRAKAPEAIKKGLENVPDVKRRQIKVTIMRKVRRFLEA
jgi:hypothetical protein